MVPLAGMLSQCLGSRSTDDANRLMQPIVRAATKAVQQGAQAAKGSSPGPEAGKVRLRLRIQVLASLRKCRRHDAWQGRKKGACTSGISFSVEGCKLTLCLPAWLVAYSAQSSMCLRHGQSAT